MNKLIPPFLLGFLALSFQILLLREFCVHFYGNEITYGLLLASWLFWGGLGSIFSSKLKFNQKIFPKTYYVIILLFPLCLIGLRFSRFALRTLPGEITGMIPMLAFSMILTLLISFPLGSLFVLNTFFSKGDISQVFLMESFGSASAGLVVHFVLIPFFPNWHSAALIGTAIALAVFLSFGTKRNKSLFVFTLAIMAALFFLDLPSQKLYWKPFHLIQTKDTPYGKLQVVKTAEQISLYNNSLRVYSYPDISTSEESVHFALLQNPNVQNVLLIGGGAGGSLRQVLKYPQVKVDYVELDPEIIRLSLRHLPEKERLTLQNERISIFYQDGRSFLDKTPKKYDAIILNLPEPATAQINRFYTKEFYLTVRDRLNDRGLFSFRVPSAENYISPELQNFLASLHYTLKEVFPSVEIVPGNMNIFLASSDLSPLDRKDINRKIETLNLQNTYISPSLLSSRLSPLRVESLKKRVLSGKKTINIDLAPISYFYNSVLWSMQFRGIEGKLFSFFSQIGTFWMLDFPLLLFALILFIQGAGRKKSSFFLTPLAVMGLTTIVVELIVIIAYQTFFGYLYKSIALLFSSFMIGLFCGSLHGKNRKRKSLVQILLIQVGFIFLLSLFLITLNAKPPELLFFIFLLCLGFLGGDLFIVSNHLYLEIKKNYGIGYGLDLMGSFLGALFASSFLIPIVGLHLLLLYILLLNSLCFLFLLWGFKSK